MKSISALLTLAAIPASLAIPIYYQCGGWEGITGECDAGLVCVVQNPYYFQCLPYQDGMTTTGGSAGPTTTTEDPEPTTTTTTEEETTTTTSTTPTSTTKSTTSTTKSTTSSTKTTTSSTKSTTTTSKASTTTQPPTTTTVAPPPTGLTTTLPASAGYSALATASVIKSGATFDGGMKRFDRAGSSGECQGQDETGEEHSVFILESGATIQNVIIGAAQAEGIHCRGPCTVKNVWWADVCEDAITIKQTGSGDVSYIIGGGAFSASDKIVQHNGAGTVSISNFYASTFGKLYRACGNCSDSYKRNVIVNNVALKGGSEGVGINENFGDTAKISKVCTNGKPSATNVCCRYKGVKKGSEPSKIGCGPSGSVCDYSTSDVTTC